MSRKQTADATLRRRIRLRDWLAEVDTGPGVTFHGIRDGDKAARNFVETVRQILSKADPNAPDR